MRSVIDARVARHGFPLAQAGQQLFGVRAHRIHRIGAQLHALFARDLALAGVGIAYLFGPLVAADLREGRLREVLADHAIQEPGLFLYFPRGAAEAPKLRASSTWRARC